MRVSAARLMLPRSIRRGLYRFRTLRVRKQQVSRGAERDGVPLLSLAWWSEVTGLCERARDNVPARQRSSAGVKGVAVYRASARVVRAERPATAVGASIAAWRFRAPTRRSRQSRRSIPPGYRLGLAQFAHADTRHLLAAPRGAPSVPARGAMRRRPAAIRSSKSAEIVPVPFSANVKETSAIVAQSHAPGWVKTPDG